MHFFFLLRQKTQKWKYKGSGNIETKRGIPHRKLDIFPTIIIYNEHNLFRFKISFLFSFLENCLHINFSTSPPHSWDLLIMQKLQSEINRCNMEKSFNTDQVAKRNRKSYITGRRVEEQERF